MGDIDFTTIAQPTTVIGLAGLAIFSVVYVILQFDKSHKKAQAMFLELIEKKDIDYQNFVRERNHQTGDIIKENTQVLVQVGENIKNNTESIKKLIDINNKNNI